MIRPALWRRVYAVLAARGETVADLLGRLGDASPTARARLARVLLGRRGREAYTERVGARAEVAGALDLPTWALDDAARWALVIEADAGEVRIPIGDEP